MPAFAVAENDVRYVILFQHRDGDFSGECPFSLIVDILRTEDDSAFLRALRQRP